LSPEERRERILAGLAGAVAEPGPWKPKAGTFEAYWLEKYGAPLDRRPIVLWSEVSLRAVVEFSHEMATLLQKQWEERLLLLCRMEGSLPGFTITPAPRSLLEGLIKHVREVQDTLDQLYLHSAGYEMFWDPPDKRGGQSQSSSLNVAINWQSDWIRKHHRNARGELDGKCSLKDTARALEWLGWDLSSMKGDKARALRSRVKRFRVTASRDPSRGIRIGGT